MSMQTVKRQTPPRKAVASAAQAETSWLRRFFAVLSVVTLTAVGLIYSHAEQDDAQDVDVYMSLPIKTSVGDNQFLIGKISLLIDPEQEKGLEQRKKHLETVITASLADSYQGPERPALTSVQKSLQTAINEHLPRKLRVREVLIQDLVLGMS